MTKVNPEFLPDINRQRYEELRKQFTEKQIACLKAEKQGNHDLAERLVEEKNHLLIELRMINPSIELTDLERILVQDAEDLTKYQVLTDEIKRRDDELKKRAS